MQDTALSIDEIYQIFRRHPGAQNKIAVDLKVRNCAVSNLLRGQMASSRIEAACRAYAEQLLVEERSA